MQRSNQNSLVAIIILGALFFIFGFVTWLNGTLIPYLKIACELTDSQSMLVTFAFYIAYFVTAIPSSWILERTGFKRGMMLGLFVMAAGALVFIPAAQSRTYWMFLAGLFIIGTGLSILQTASNPYITIVGPIESAAKRISIMGICNKVAGALAPIALGAVILSNAEGLKSELVSLDAAARAVRLDELASRVVTPYTLMAVVLVILGIGVRMSPLPEIDLSGEQEGNDNTSKDKPSVWAYPNLVLGVIALFLYVGAEVIAGDTIANYGTSQGISLDEAKYFTTYTLVGMIIGYILGILLIPKIISQATALAASAITGIIFSILITLTDGYTSVLLVALLGFANALVWPAIWPLAIDGLGRHTKTASALLIMAIAGGALLPQVYGQLSEVASIGPKMAYLLLIPCYLFVLLYGRILYKRKNW